MVKISPRRFVLLVAALGLAAGACGRGTAPVGVAARLATPTNSVSVPPALTFSPAPTSTNLGSTPVATTPPPPVPTDSPVGVPTPRTAASTMTPPLSPTASPQPSAAPAGAEGQPAGEGAGAATAPEGASSTLSVTDPGGLPPSPPTNDPTISQIGEERYVLYQDPQGRYQISFVSTWQVAPGPAPESVVARQADRTIQVEIAGSGGKDATAQAGADAARLAVASPGYHQLALRPSQIPYGPVASLIYRFEQGTNAVTGKGNLYIAGRIYVARQGSPNDLAVVTVTAPAAFYGDFTQIFDYVVASFRWR